ncbi:coatomer subunit alpha [Anaeramoeba flamelloides]|uniref:Coatomer subunit alpha n=1 Tax=Anaeramoeba flamelloides TaxID=1746091 RepID=A0ABQ8XV67_9EUKA|nr:coatomer subunit alpha [Anaeramoeba flamelloides]
MNVKLTRSSPKVKSVCFHSKKPLIIVGLINGSIQILNYESNKLVNEYSAHKGAVRGLDLHAHKPFIVSGGDDQIVLIYSFEKEEIISRLKGHTDYIRCVQFHKKYSWVLSCGDDFRIRLWDYPRETQIAVFVGHQNFVMSAHFHPSNDLLVSSSLDKTICVWDLSFLEDRKKISGLSFTNGGNTSNNKNTNTSTDTNTDTHTDTNTDNIYLEEYNFLKTKLISFKTSKFYTNDPKFVLNNHQNGVNYCIFHPSKPLLASASDDKTIIIWDLNEDIAKMNSVLEGHNYAVTSLVFCGVEKDQLMSCGEDGQIKLWSISQKKYIKTIENIYPNQFWCLSCHPNLPLYAVGHNEGYNIFKLKKTKVPSFITPNSIFYAQNQKVFVYNTKSQKLSTVLDFSKHSSFNSTEKITFCQSEESFSLYCQNKFEIFTKCKNGEWKNNNMKKVGKGFDLTYLDNSRIALCNSKGNILIKHLYDKKRNKLLKQKNTFYKNIYSSYAGTLLVTFRKQIGILNLEQKSIISKMSIVETIKEIKWAQGKKYVALLSKRGIIICDNKLNQLASISISQSSIKSGVWFKSKIFIFTTKTQLKYLFINGEVGLIKTLKNSPCHLLQISKNQIIYFNKENIMEICQFKANELLLKIAIEEKNANKIKKILNITKFPGNFMIQYLRKKGYPNIALKLTNNLQSQFDLAILSNNLSIALDLATKLNKDFFWKQLSSLALENGNIDLVETCYQKCYDFEKLSFLYLITGNLTNLRKIQNISKNTNLNFMNSLYLCSIEKRIQLLIKSKKYCLAYLLAFNNGLIEKSEEIKNKFQIKIIANQKSKFKPTLFKPTLPIFINNQSWPLLKDNSTKHKNENNNTENNSTGQDNGWENDIDIDFFL